MSNSNIPTIDACKNLSENLLNPRLNVIFIGYHSIPSWDYDSLSAPYWRLYRNNKDGGVIHFPNRKNPTKSLQMEKHALILIPPDTKFDSYGMDIEQFYLHFTARPPFYQINQPFFILPNDTIIHSLIEELIKGFCNPKKNIEVSLVAHTLATYALTHVPHSALMNLIIEDRVIKTMDMIDKNFPHTISNTELAGRVSMSPNSLARLFREHTGVSIQNYLINLRMSKAGDLLLYSEKSIEEIATETGYVDRFQFSKAFKKAKGVPPVKYRHKRT